MDLHQLLTPSEAARLADMSLRKFLYYMRENRSPRPHYIGVFKHPFFVMSEIEAWKPTRKISGRKRA